MAWFAAEEKSEYCEGAVILPQRMIASPQKKQRFRILVRPGEEIGAQVNCPAVIPLFSGEFDVFYQFVIGRFRHMFQDLVHHFINKLRWSVA